MFLKFWIIENTTFRKLDLFPSSDEGRETHTLLDALERANLNHWTTGKFQKLSNSECDTPTSECFRFRRYNITVLEFGTIWKKVASFMTRPLYSRRESPGIHWLWGCVSAVDALDTAEKRTISRLRRDSIRGLTAHRLSLYLLNYSGSTDRLTDHFYWNIYRDVLNLGLYYIFRFNS
jgi:hypothetical protein